jgi:hypothetical protein
MMRSDRNLAASWASKIVGVANWFVPDSMKSAANRLIVTHIGSRR